MVCTSYHRNLSHEGMERSDGGKVVHVGNLILERTRSVSFLGVAITQTDAESYHHQNHNHLAIIKN